MTRRKTVLPGHMKKAIERIEELAPVVDVALEVVDARAPDASACPIITKILTTAYHVKVLSKADLADAAVSREWREKFTEQGATWSELPFGKHVPADIFLKKLKLPGLDDPGRMIKALIIGIPNVGKSTLINALVGRRRAHTGARPGITKGLQLISLADNVYLYDTPGVINPTIRNETQGHILGLIGCLQENLFDVETAAYFLSEHLVENYTAKVKSTYGIDIPAHTPPEDLLEMLARRRGFLLKGGAPDIDRACRTLVNDFATGKLKGITLEYPV